MTNTIQKREMFDEDNMTHLLNDDRFNKKDRDRLKTYNKHRLSGGTMNVSYKYGAGCEENKLGRLFPDDGLGLQSYRFDIRNPLARKYYWDTDVDNCHFIIAYKWCHDLGIYHEHIGMYINNRDEWLSKVSSNRKKAKTELLKTLYLGNLHLYCEDFSEVVDGDILFEGKAFLHNLQIEMERLAEAIWNKFPQYHKLKLGSDKKMICKKPNPKASLMSIIFQTEERKILLLWDAFLTRNNRYMGVYIHDGGYVEKLEGETAFPENFLIEGAKFILDESGYEVKLSQKDIKYDWEPKHPQKSQYEVMKAEFEKNNFLVGSSIYSIHTDGYMEILKEKDAKIIFANKQFYEEDEKGKTKTVSFFKRWLEDPTRRFYQRVDFIPNIESCPDTIYNLFKGFNAEKFRPDIPFTEEEITTLVAPIITHLDYLTSGHAAWVLKWFANIIQTPHLKSQIAPVIRDMDGLLHCGGGTGKNLYIEWFGNQILGEQYFQVVGNNSELYGAFNSMFEGKLLIFVEEANGKDNHSNNDILKSQITQNKRNVNKKNIAQYNINDYSRYIFSTNNKNSLKFNRRFAFFDANQSKQGDVAYFENLTEKLDNDTVKWAFYQYLKILKTYDTPIQFEKSIPINSTYIEIKNMNAPLYHKWLVNCIQTKTLIDGSSTQLYGAFKEWVTTNREKDTYIISMTEFGKLLSNAPEINIDSEYAGYELENVGDKKRTNQGMTMKWNIDGLVNSLKQLHLLEEAFDFYN